MLVYFYHILYIIFVILAVAVALSVRSRRAWHTAVGHFLPLPKAPEEPYQTLLLHIRLGQVIALAD